MVRSVINKGFDLCLPKEADADGPITPGMGVNRTGEDTVAAGGGDALLIAYNNGDVGQGKEDDYEAGNRVKFVNPPKGVEAEVLVDGGSEGETVEADDTTLGASADGGFTTADGDDVLALEDADVEAGDTARVQVEVI